MKNLLILFIVFSFIACQDDSASSLINDNSTVLGTWKVKSYIDNKGRDQTSNYTAYTFNFLENGTLEAVKSGAKTKGTYSNLTDSGKQKFIINMINANSELSELNEDWILIEKTDKQMTLTNLSGGNGGKSTLIFTK
jgi:hypothetical protein